MNSHPGYILVPVGSLKHGDEFLRPLSGDVWVVDTVSELEGFVPNPAVISKHNHLSVHSFNQNDVAVIRRLNGSCPVWVSVKREHLTQMPFDE